MVQLKVEGVQKKSNSGVLESRGYWFSVGPFEEMETERGREREREK